MLELAQRVSGIFRSIGAALSPLADSVWSLLNTNFSAALFGALAGALSAHWIATRSERRKALRQEIAGVNSAIALSNTISNAFVSIKRNHIIAMAGGYKREFDALVRALRQAQGQQPIFSTLDFQTLAMPLTPIEELRQAILEKVSSSGAAISISVVLHQCISSLEHTLASREEMIALLQKMNQADRVLSYFGLRTSAGHIDQRFPDHLNAIVHYVDDGIYFPMLLVDVLVAHGEKQRKIYGRNAPRVLPIVYDKKLDGLLPDRSNYPDFEKTYRSPSMPKASWSDIFEKAWLATKRSFGF